MKNLMFFLLVTVTFALTSCSKSSFGCVKGEGSIETRNIDLNNFEKVAVSFDTEVTFVEGAEQKVEIRSYPNIIDAILDKSEVRNNEWKIEVPNGCYNVQQNEVEIFITIPTIKAISTSGDAKIMTDGVFSNINDLKLSSSGDATFNMNFEQVNRLELTSSGDAIFALTGAVDMVNIDCSGDVLVQNTDLIARAYDINTSGDAKGEINVTETLDANSSGDINMCFTGTPTITTHISGDGAVEECN